MSRFCFLITYECNLRCKYCYLGDRRQKVGKQDYSKLPELAREVSKKYLDADYFVDTVKIYGAEPTVVPPEILAEVANIFKANLKENGWILFNTNGTLLTEEYVTTFTKLAFGKVRWIVSIDGPPPVTDKSRGRGTFEKAWEGAKRLKAAGYQVKIGLTYTDALIEDLKQLEWFEKLVLRHNMALDSLLPHSGATLRKDLQVKLAKYAVARNFWRRDVLHFKRPMACFKNVSEDLRFDCEGKALPCHVQPINFYTSYKGKSFKEICESFTMPPPVEGTANCGDCFVKPYCEMRCPLYKPEYDINCDYLKTVFEELAKYQGISREQAVSDFIGA